MGLIAPLQAGTGGLHVGFLVSDFTFLRCFYVFKLSGRHVLAGRAA